LFPPLENSFFFPWILNSLAVTVVVAAAVTEAVAVALAVVVAVTDSVGFIGFGATICTP
jgi:hypothetical protein